MRRPLTWLLSPGQNRSHTETCHHQGSAGWKEEKPIQTSLSQKWRTFLRTRGFLMQPKGRKCCWAPRTRKTSGARVAPVFTFPWPRLACLLHLLLSGVLQTNLAEVGHSIASRMILVWETNDSHYILIPNSWERTYNWFNLSFCKLLIQLTAVRMAQQCRLTVVAGREWCDLRRNPQSYDTLKNVAETASCSLVSLFPFFDSNRTLWLLAKYMVLPFLECRHSVWRGSSHLEPCNGSHEWGMAEQKYWQSLRSYRLWATISALNCSSRFPCDRKINVCLVYAIVILSFLSSSAKWILYTRGHMEKQTCGYSLLYRFMAIVHGYSTHMHVCTYTCKHTRHHTARMEGTFLSPAWPLNYIFCLTFATRPTTFASSSLWVFEGHWGIIWGRYSGFLAGVVFPANGQILSPANDRRASGEHQNPLFSRRQVIISFLWRSFSYHGWNITNN